MGARKAIQGRDLSVAALIRLRQDAHGTAPRAFREAYTRRTAAIFDDESIRRHDDMKSHIQKYAFSLRRRRGTDNRSIALYARIATYGSDGQKRRKHFHDAAKQGAPAMSRF